MIDHGCGKKHDLGKIPIGVNGLQNWPFSTCMVVTHIFPLISSMKDIGE